MKPVIYHTTDWAQEYVSRNFAGDQSNLADIADECEMHLSFQLRMLKEEEVRNFLFSSELYKKINNHYFEVFGASC